MKTDIIIALISFLGTMAGTLGGILTSSKLTSYRIEQLEKKVEVHNNFAGRMPVIEEKLRVVNHRLSDLENELHQAE
ncbi:MAG: hypothetical protein U0L72_01925 [Acutalibacteraceae bacterium]|nr:hypothetical protein [Acutalibacteraceae bacterium]